MMKLFYMLYFAGIALFLLNSLSYALFAKSKWKRRIKRIFSAIFFSILWPLSLFSEEGRRVLFSKTINL